MPFEHLAKFLNQHIHVVIYIYCLLKIKYVASR